MEMWEAIEVYADREIDFTKDVLIVNDLDTITITWNIYDIAQPSESDLNVLMNLEPLIKIKYDSNGFIWDIDKGVKDMENSENYNIVTINHPKINGPFVEQTYGLPLYKLVDDAVILITDMTDYQIDSVIWDRYKLKIQDEIRIWLTTKTNDELKTIYNSSPPYIQEELLHGIQFYWSSKVPQWYYNISFEIMLRVMIEKMYIETIENRSLTTDELASFNNVVSTVRNCNGMLRNQLGEEGPNLGTDHWYHNLLNQMSGSCSLLRQYEEAQRLYVTGVSGV